MTDITSTLAKFQRVAFLTTAMFLAGCNLLTGGEETGLEAVLTPQKEDSEKVSIESQRANDPQSRIGAKEHPKIVQSYGGALENEKLENMLAVVVSDLVAASNDPNHTYDVTVLDSPLVNAFALPGGYLYITRGLVALANDLSEIAAVLAHEMAHVSANHGIERSQKAKENEIAKRVLTEVVTNPLATNVTGQTVRQNLATFSQKQELQADAISIKLLGKAGYDPFAASRFLLSMQRYTKWREGQGESADMASSHPSTPRRIELAKRHARLVGPPGTGKTGRERYLAGVDGMMFGDKAEDGFIRGRKFAHKKLAITFTAPQDFSLRNREDAVLAGGPGEQALRFDAVAVNGSDDPATYLKSGWVNGLVESSIQPVEDANAPTAIARAQAGDWSFAVSVSRLKGRFYRFILTAPRGTLGLDEKLLTVAKSFRSLSQKEVKQLKPLRIKVTRWPRGRPQSRMVSKIAEVSQPKQLFETLNGLTGPASHNPKVKLVVE